MENKKLTVEIMKTGNIMSGYISLDIASNFVTKIKFKDNIELCIRKKSHLSRFLSK